MPLTFNGLSGAAVAVSGTIETTPTTRDAKIAALQSTNVNSGASATIATVGVGKKWRIVAAMLSSLNTAAGTLGTVQLRLNGVCVVGVAKHNATTYGSGGESNSISFPYDTAPVLAAGQTATIYADNADAGRTISSITYYEETV